MHPKLDAGLRWLLVLAATVAPALLGFNCGGSPLTAPSGATLSIASDRSTIPVVDGVATITVRGFKASSDGGGPLADGTQVYFTTPVGMIEDRVEMTGGVARAYLRSDGRAGSAAVVATAGAGVSATLNPPVLIGSPTGITILLAADPTIANPPDLTGQITAVVIDSNGSPTFGAPVIFSATAGALASAGSVLRTDALGRAVDRLSLANARVARVSALSGSARSNTVTVVQGGFTGPLILSVSPSSGSPGQTLAVTIAGLNFQSGSTLDFGAGITATVSTLSSTAIQAQVNIAAMATAGPRDVTVSLPAGAGSDTLPAGFTVGGGTSGSPVVSSVTPASGAPGQTLSVTVMGSNFQQGAQVSFEAGITVTVGAVTPTAVQAQIAIAATATPGARRVTVTNPDGTSGSLPNGFTVSTAQ